MTANGIDASRAGVAESLRTGDLSIDRRITGPRWATDTLTFGFGGPTSRYGGVYDPSIPGGAYSPPTELLRATVRETFAMIGEYVALRFAETGDTPNGAGDVRIAVDRTVTSSFGAAVTPSGSSAGGDIFLPTSYQTSLQSSLASGSALRQALTQSVLITLGVLPEVSSGVLLTLPLPGVGTALAVQRLPASGAALTPTLNEVRALQHIYGANPTTGTGDQTYAAQSSLRVVWDVSGVDTFDFSGAFAGATIDLRGGGSSRIGASASLAIAPGAVIENAVGSRFNDAIIGNDDGNRITAGLGSDTIDGGGGMDTVVFSGARRNVARAGSAVTVTLGAEADRLTNVERLQFTDGTLALDTTGTAGQAYRLYQAAFARTPDAGGLGFWTRRLDSGGGLLETAQFFAASPEFQTRYGALDDRSFVDQAYRNVLGRTGDPGGTAFWTGRLAAGVSRGEVLLGFADSPENQALVAPRIADGIWFV